MRTNIDIDDDLMAEVLELTGLKTKREAVEQGLRVLLRLRKQEQLQQFWAILALEQQPNTATIIQRKPTHASQHTTSDTSEP